MALAGDQFECVSSASLRSLAWNLYWPAVAGV